MSLPAVLAVICLLCPVSRAQISPAGITKDESAELERVSNLRQAGDSGYKTIFSNNAGDLMSSASSYVPIYEPRPEKQSKVSYAGGAGDKDKGGDDMAAAAGGKNHY
jgi:hypothetical protein